SFQTGRRMDSPTDENRDLSAHVVPCRSIRLRSPLVAMIAILIYCALAAVALLVGWENVFGVLFMLGWVGLLFGAVRAAKNSKGFLSFLLFVMFMLIFFALLDWGATPAAKEVARRVTCVNNLRSIGKALLRYEEVHGYLPPVSVMDANGNQLQSWRTLI